jgi:hypothetical protein
VRRIDRATKLSTQKSQTREPWQLRAIKLQLLYPNRFVGCLVLTQSSAPMRERALSYFCEMGRFGILNSIDFGMLTSYRITLFLRACRSYDRQCRKERARVQHSPQDTASSSGAEQTLGPDRDQKPDTRQSEEDHSKLVRDIHSLEYRMVFKESESLPKGVMEGHGP